MKVAGAPRRASPRGRQGRRRRCGRTLVPAICPHLRQSIRSSVRPRVPRWRPLPRQATDGAGLHPHPRRADAQPQEHRSRPSARQADRDHRPVRLGQVVAGLRHASTPKASAAMSNRCRPTRGSSCRLMEKPDVDHIEGLSPAISIEQKSTSHNPRSTVGTITEIYDYLRLLYARVGTPRCPDHGYPLRGADRQPDGRPGRRAGRNRGGPRAALHAAGAGDPRTQGRARAGLRAVARAGLRARARGRRAATRSTRCRRWRCARSTPSRP